jgi:hypothetical protein
LYGNLLINADEINIKLQLKLSAHGYGRTYMHGSSVHRRMAD